MKNTVKRHAHAVTIHWRRYGGSKARSPTQERGMEDVEAVG